MAFLRYIHHSFFLLSLPTCNVLIDPFLNIPKEVNVKPKLMNSSGKKYLKNIDIILISHEHFDHFDKKLIEEIVARDNACVVAHDHILSQLNIKRSNKYAIAINKRACLRGISVEAFPVHHPTSFYPLGFKIKYNNTSFVHLGDTFLMDSFNKLKADVLMVPIGGATTMDVTDAVKVVKSISPKVVVPMHYNTFDMIKASPLEFREKIEDSIVATKVAVLKPGARIKI